jgi:hypothetical protein
MFNHSPFCLKSFHRSLTLTSRSNMDYNASKFELKMGLFVIRLFFLLQTNFFIVLLFVIKAFTSINHGILLTKHIQVYSKCLVLYIRISNRRKIKLWWDKGF